MVYRSIRLPKTNSFFLFGARGTGKTSLVKAFSINPNSVLYIDLLNDELADRYLSSPQLLKQEIEALKKKPEWVIIDEVQKVPKLLNVAHQLIESPHKIKFILTGSSSRRLKQKGVNLLAGRAWVRNLYPFTFQELESNFHLDQILNWGSLPKIFDLKDASEKEDYLKSYTYTYIKSEIQQEQWIRKLEPFRKFLPIAAQMNGKPLNYSSLSRDVNVEHTTIKSYYEILEDTLLGFHLPAYHKSIRKQQRESPKFYFFDLGVKKALQKILSVPLVPQTSEWGFAFEHLVICEIYRLKEYYQKEWDLSYLLTKDGFEIDLIISQTGKKDIYIEIKSSEKIHDQEFTKFKNFCKENKSEGYVLSTDPIARTEEKVHFLPWQEGLKRIFEI